MDKLADLIYPPKCVLCRQMLKKGESGVCAPCAAMLEENKSGLRLTGEFIDGGLACARYSDSVRKSIHAFKFGGHKEYCRAYAEIMARRAADMEELLHCDLATTVPTGRTNIKKRGYDHAALLAAMTAERLGIPFVPTLARVRETRPMYGLGQAERRANMLGSVKISCDREQIAGRKVLFIDDIMTTGVTAGECARVLRSAGASSVFVLTLAKTENNC